jgi:hypothetical protein
MPAKGNFVSPESVVRTEEIKQLMHILKPRTNGHSELVGTERIEAPWFERVEQHNRDVVLDKFWDPKVPEPVFCATAIAG